MLLSAVLMVIVGCALMRPAGPTFVIDAHQLQPELALDTDARRRGLQHRRPPSGGLILGYPVRDQHGIWMPNCTVPLEAWVVSDEGILLEIMPLPTQPARMEGEAQWVYHARLPRHYPHHEARLLWEFEAGRARSLQVAVGDHIEGPWDRVLAEVE